VVAAQHCNPWNCPPSTWGGINGCNEYLNVCSPETIVKLHSLFLEAGAMVIETNTFGATSIVLAEYGLENRVREINEAAVANARRLSEKNYIL